MFRRKPRKQPPPYTIPHSSFVILLNYLVIAAIPVALLYGGWVGVQSVIKGKERQREEQEVAKRACYEDGRKVGECLQKGILGGQGRCSSLVVSLECRGTAESKKGIEDGKKQYKLSESEQKIRQKKAVQKALESNRRRADQIAEKYLKSYKEDAAAIKK